MTYIDRRQWLKYSSLIGLGLPFAGALKGQPVTDAHLSAKENRGGMIRLNYNENPYGPSPTVRQSFINMFDDVCRYPFQKIRELQAAIAEKEGVSPDNIVVSGGSREGLHAAGLLSALEGGNIVTATPTYGALLRYAERFGAEIKKIPLDENLGIDLKKMDEAIDDQTQMAFVCNPNNPTGALLDKTALTDFCREASRKTLVFVDEVYYDYITETDYPTMISLIKEGQDIVVSRTFSKIYGIAGIRVGYLVASEERAGKLRDALMATTNILGANAALSCLKYDADFYNHCLQKNNEAKELIYKALDNLGLTYIRSHTNFVFFHTKKDIKAIQDAFESKGILVGRAFPPYHDWCRVSTGLVKDIEVFCDRLPEVFS